MNLRRKLLEALTPLARLMASSDADLMRNYEEISQLIQPGDVIVTRTKWRPTNALIPGFYNHAVFYVGGDRVVHALDRVELVSLPILLSHVDDYAIMRPSSFTPEELEKACNIAKTFVGLPYDYNFEPTPDALYCSELVTVVLQQSKKDWPFEWRKRLGVLTVIPQDFRDAKVFFDKILEYRKK